MIPIIAIIAVNMMIEKMIAAIIGPVQLQVSGWGRGFNSNNIHKVLIIFL